MTMETQSQQRGIIDPLGQPGMSTMRRDMDLIRGILEATEQRTERDPKLVKLADHDDLIVGQHVELLFRSGFWSAFLTKVSTRHIPWFWCGI
jgi:hypothetical protein